MGENLRVGGRHLTREEYTIEKFGIYAMLCPPSKKAELPAGYTLGKLAKEHTMDMVAQDGLWIGSVRSKMIEYIEQCRQRLETVAVFRYGDTSKPVAWALRYAATGAYGSLFTRPDHRRKGLASLVIQEISEKFSSEGDIPFAGASDDSISSNMHLKLGFGHVGTGSCMYISAL